MEAQEVFETVARHLFAQGKRAWDGERQVCCYRAPDGTRCAVGCLISDAVYREAMEGKNAFGLRMEFGDVFPLADEHGDLLRRLQKVHDGDSEFYSVSVTPGKQWASTEAMRWALKVVGGQHGLNTAFLDQLSFADR